MKILLFIFSQILVELFPRLFWFFAFGFSTFSLGDSFEFILAGISLLLSLDFWEFLCFGIFLFI